MTLDLSIDAFRRTADWADAAARHYIDTPDEAIAYTRWMFEQEDGDQLDRAERRHDQQRGAA